MKGIIRFSLNNKFAIWILTIIITVAGLYAGMTMKQETLPDLDLPVLQVMTIYPGAAPGEVVDTVSKPLEQRIKNLNGVQTVTSTSMENASAITVEYDYGYDMEKAESDVREALSSVKLPDAAQQSTVTRININAFPVITLSVSDSKVSMDELTKRIEGEVKPIFEGLGGVGSVSIAGQQLKEVELKFHAEKMKQLGLSEDTVKGIVQGSALNVPLGVFEMGKEQKTIVVDGNIKSIDDLKNIRIPVIPSLSAGGAPVTGANAAQLQGAQVGSAAGVGAGVGAEAEAGSNAAAGLMAGIPTVALKDVADIQVLDKVESISRTNGEPSISIQVVKSADANTVEVVNAVKDQVKQYALDYPDMKIVTMLDQGKPIEDSVSTMLNKAVFGALFAVIIILLFLRNFRTTIISIISIPLSLLIGVLVLREFNITLNMMSLGAMTVAIGRVVDDSIVVIENIYRRMTSKTEKLKGKELILEATKEMFMPIFSSTIVTIAVFLPLALVSGMVGELFIPFALTMVFALLASLLVAITIVPMLGHSMFRNGLKNTKAHHDKPGKLAEFYKRILNWTLNHKFITFLVAIMLLLASTSLVFTKAVGVSFLPDQEEKYVMVSYTPAPGELRTDVEQDAAQAEAFIIKRQGVEKMQYSIGGSGNPMMSLGGSGTNSALFYVIYDSKTKNFEDEKKALVQGIQNATNAAGVWKQMDMAGGFGGSQMTLTVYGDSLDDIAPVVTKIEDIMKQDSTFDKVESTMQKTYAQYTLVANQEKLSKYGLTAGQIAMKLSPVRTQPVLTTVEVEGKDLNVYVHVDEAKYAGIQDIENTMIQSPLGMQVPLKEVVDVKEETSPNTVTRKDGRMFINVTADITSQDVASASKELQKKIDGIEKLGSVKVEFGGVTEQINETFTQLGLAMAAAIAIVYFVLVVTFGGALAPLAILFSLPFAIIGGLVALWIAGETISVSAMMGALMLIGIVVTNAIVLLDRVIHKEHEGMTTREALLEAAGTRLRPILMTALATIGALIPLALGFEGAGIISKGLGVTVIGGLTSSTLLTLVIVPIVYEFLMKFRKKQREELV